MDKSELTMKWRGLPLTVELGTYANGGLAITTLDEDGQPFCTASVWVEPSPDLPPDECYIKDYSENTGILEALERALIVKRTGGRLPSGHAVVHHVKLVRGIEEGAEEVAAEVATKKPPELTPDGEPQAEVKGWDDPTDAETLNLGSDINWD